MLVSSAPDVDQLRNTGARRDEKADKSLNILYQSMRWAPELLAAHQHSKFRAEIRPRTSDDDQHARVPSGSLHPSDDFEKRELLEQF